MKRTKAQRPSDVTGLLLRLRDVDVNVVDELAPLVYDELRRLAMSQLRRERADHTLNATALVHEAYLKLVDQTRVNWQNRAQFFALAAQAMRRILINYAQSRMAQKRGGGHVVVTFNEELVPRQVKTEELLCLDEALTRLRDLDERQAKVVEFRFFAGLKDQEIAEVLSVSVPTVRRDWRLARAWLRREIADR